MKHFYGQKGAGQGSCTQQKAGWLSQGHFPLGDAGVHQADGLTSADQGIPDSLV